MVASKQELERELIFRRCSEDFEYFLSNYWQIPIPGTKGGTLEFENRPYQYDFAKLLQNSELIVSLKARQIGLTTMAIAYAFWTIFFRPNHPWLIVSVGEDAAKRAVGRVRYGYNRLPAWMRERGPKLTTDAAQNMAFDNESKLEALPSTAAAGRGDTVFGVIFDEAAHMVDAASVFGALEPLTIGIMIVFSTAKGMGNWFHARWLDSQQRGSAWTGVFYPWSVVPERDGDWYDRTKAKYVGEEWLFFQEYPSTPEEAFAKSGQVAISEELLKLQDWRPPEFRFRWNPWTRGWEEMEDPSEVDDVTLRVWELPYVERDEQNRLVRDPNYVLFVDTAEGLAHGDFNAITVMNANTREEVAAIETKYPIEYLGELVESLGYWYHTALVVVERNNTGLVPITYLSKDARYPRLYRLPALGKRKHADRSERYGWRTGVDTKPKMIHDLTHALREGQVTLHNERFRLQMQTYVRDGKGSYNATAGNHDDAVISTLGAWQGVLDVGEYPTYYYDDEAHVPTWGDVIAATEALVPQGRNPLETPIGQREKGQGWKPSVHLG